MPSQPSGTVTFLFTDLEGSTRLWETHSREMAQDLVVHDRVIRETIEAQDGYVFETAGDAFAAAFRTPYAGLAAAVGAQRGLAMTPWTVPGGLRARMSLHTGAADERDGNYFGPTLNRVARILSAGYGGQVLLSEAMRELLDQTLPDGVAVQDLGVHRLKDLSRRERIYQLVVQGLRAEFPPLRSLDLFRHNLPIELTSFIGRDQEIDEVRRLLDSARAVTLTGIGGAGKTRLSLRVAADVVETIPDGVWQVRLEGISDPAHVVMATAIILGVPEQGGRPVLETLVDQLRSKSLLIVLDNCEHVVAACAEMAERLLGAAPGLKVLATSREPLRIAGEIVFQVPPLTLPSGLAHQKPADLSGFAAIRLFVDRARAAVSSFTLTEQNAPAIVQICRQLDGIPLAIELAAARVRVLPVDQISARLDDRFRLLIGGARTALPRQQALRATLDWSYDLLSAPEQLLLRRCGVFAGGFTLEAAEAVCAGDGLDRLEILDLVAGLADKSLLVPSERRGSARYRLLETVRQYALTRLDEAGERRDAALRHFSFYAALAEVGNIFTQERFDQLTWLDAMDDEHDNVRAALGWSAGEDPGAALRLVQAVCFFWLVRGHLQEGRDWTDRVLAANRDRPSGRLGRAHYVACLLARRRGDLAAATAHADESVRLALEHGDTVGLVLAQGMQAWIIAMREDFARGARMIGEVLAAARATHHQEVIADVLQAIGFMNRQRGQSQDAATAFRESIAIRNKTGNLWANAISRHNLALIARREGDYDRAVGLHIETRSVFEQLGDRGGLASTENSLGLIALTRGDYEAARRSFEQALPLFRDLGDKGGVALAMLSLSRVALHTGEIGRASELCRESLAMRREMGDRRGEAESLDWLAAIEAAHGAPLRAARLWGAAEALRETIGISLPPADREERDRGVSVARVAAGEAPFAAAWSEGRNTPIDNILADARSGRQISN